jgi:hypothetical protein
MNEIFYHPWTYKFIVRHVPDEDELITSQIETLRVKVDTLQTSKDADVTSLHGKVDTLQTSKDADVTSLHGEIDTLQTSKDADVTSLHGKIDVNHGVVTGAISTVNDSVVALEATTSGFTANIAQLQAAIIALQ